MAGYTGGLLHRGHAQPSGCRRRRMGLPVLSGAAPRRDELTHGAARHGRSSRGAASTHSRGHASGAAALAAGGAIYATSIRAEIYRRAPERHRGTRSERGSVEESDATYYKRAITKAMQHKCPLALRRGGGRYLGLRHGAGRTTLAGVRTHPHSEPLPRAGRALLLPPASRRRRHGLPAYGSPHRDPLASLGGEAGIAVAVIPAPATHSAGGAGLARLAPWNGVH